MAAMELSHEELVALYLSGNEPAFADLTARTIDQVYAFAVRYVGDSVLAEDIVQETYVKVWKNLRRYNPDTSKFTTWLMRIARNTAVDTLRKKKHVPMSAFDTPDGTNTLLATTAATDTQAEEALIAQETSAAVQHAVQQLPYAQREVLTMHYTNHMTFDEIAQATGELPNTVKSRHFRALQALRKLLNAPNT
jgi:RNA polymerase sigma-70 factor (ECF subfamily)